MVEIAGAGVSAALEQASQPAAAPVIAPGTASPESVQRFESLLQPPEPGVTPPADGVAGVQGPAPAEASAGAGPASPGDAILRGIERMSQGFNEQLQQVQRMAETASGATMSASDLMRTQFALTQVTMQQDVTSKVVGKATNDLDTFLKNQ